MKFPALHGPSSLGGISPLENSASLANAGIVYFMLKDWSERGKGEDLLSIYDNLNSKLADFQDAATLVLVPPPIQGLGLSGGFQMQVELTDGSYDFARLQRAAEAIAEMARKNPVIRAAFTPFRAEVPQIAMTVDPAQAETLGVPVGDVYDTLQTYLGSSFVNLFTKFGHNFMVLAQADAKDRLTADALKSYYVRSQTGQMVPLGTLADIRPTVGPSVISLYNLFPSATINGAANRGYSSGQALETLRSIADKALGPGMSYEWTAMSYQEKLVGNSVYFILAWQFCWFIWFWQVSMRAGSRRRRSSSPYRWRCWARWGPCWASGLRTTFTCRSAWCC